MSARQAAVPSAARVIAIARQWVGVRFRPQGRDRGGVDCIGLLAAVWGEAGARLVVPADYALRDTPPFRVEAGLESAGFARLSAVQAVAGDILLAEPASGQSHLALLAGESLIEANAGVGRVIERRLRPDEPWQTAWRYLEWIG